MTAYDTECLQGVVAALERAGCEYCLIGSIWEAAAVGGLGDVAKAVSWAWYMTTQA